MSTEPNLPRPKADVRDARPRAIAAIAAALVLLVVVGLATGYLAIGRARSAAEASVRGPEQLFQNGPGSNTDVDRSWASLEQPSRLPAQDYAWIDRKTGVVQVPIDRAIDLVCAEQGVEGAKSESHTP